MRFRLALACIVVATGAVAQSFQDQQLIPVNGGFNGSSFTGAPLPSDQVLVNRVFSGIPQTSSLPLSAFASSSDIAALNTRIDNLSAISPSFVALAALANQLQRNLDRQREGTALAGALTILQPNPGDRFAVTFSGAGYEGTAAGSASVSMRIGEDAVAFVGYARSQNQNLVKGGIGFSIR